METDKILQSENFLPVIKEYETAIDTLTTQLEFYAIEQENLRKEITTLITENKLLAKTVHELLESQSNAHLDDEEKDFDRELVQNLKNQLSLTLKEKDIVVQLWQTALKNVDHLEEELKLFEGRTHGYFSKSEVLKMKRKYEHQIKELEEQLIQCQSKLDVMTKVSAKNLENKNQDLEKALAGQKNTATLVEHLEGEVNQLQNKVKQIMELRDELQKTLDAKTDLIEELKIKDIQARAKVTEAVQVVEAAFFEKDAALLRENEAKDEVVKISKTLSEIIDEAGAKLKSETEKMKQQCAAKIMETQRSMENLKEELIAKDNEIEKHTRECKLLEEELQRIKSGNIFIDDSKDTKLLTLEKNVEATFQKLLLSERKLLQVTAERESIKADLEQMASCYENDIKTREVEKRVLRHQVQSLRKQLKQSNANLIVVAGQVDKLNSKIKLLDVEMREKLQRKDIEYQEMFIKTMENVENKNKTVQNDMQAQLNLHKNLNTRWKKEMQEIIDKFENRMKELKEVNKTLRNKLKNAVNETLKLKQKQIDIGIRLNNMANFNQNKENIK